MSSIIIAVLVLSGIGIVLAALLAVGRKVFYVEVDERQEKLMEILPGANCGGCGYPGCSGYAAALVRGDVSPALCPPGGAALAGEIGKLLGVEVGSVERKVARVACAGDASRAEDRGRYQGVLSCLAAHQLVGGPKKCTYGCLGLGSCRDACPFDAIVISEKGIAFVDSDKCTGCAQCVAACPRDLIDMVPAVVPVHVMCKNPNKARQVKPVCQVGCTGCKGCAKQSPRFVVTGALASVDYETTGDIPEEACLACPQGAIFDARRATVKEWIEGDARADFEARREAWKASKKGAAKRRKAAEEGASGAMAGRSDAAAGGDAAPAGGKE